MTSQAKTFQAGTSPRKKTRNLLIIGAVAALPLLGLAAVNSAAANTSDPVETITYPIEHDANRDGYMDIVPLPATLSPAELTRPAPVDAEIESPTPDGIGGIESRDEQGNLVAIITEIEPVHPNSLAR